MFSGCDWFPSQTFHPKRYKPGNTGNWSGHLPFAHDLTVGTRPSLFVELGTHLGESYFGFCQAIAEHSIPCFAYAVDTWTGDEHSGFYDESVYRDVSEYNEVNYSGFSNLLKSTFDNALQHFSDDSIDVLHIDGLHTFEAVSHDFRLWLPKVRPGGIVLLHDIVARHSDFGVCKLWAKLKEQGNTFEFHHSWGLGVYQKPTNVRDDPEMLRGLFESSDNAREHIRRYYSLAAAELEYQHASRGVDGTPQVQAFLPQPTGYSEAFSHSVPIKVGKWECVTLELLEGSAAGRLRVDLPDRTALIDLRGVEICSSVDGNSIWKAVGPELETLTVGGTMVALTPQKANDARRFFSYGNDPQLYLPDLGTELLDQPLNLKLWVRVRTELQDLVPNIEQPNNGLGEAVPSKVESRLESQVYTLREELDSQEKKLRDLEGERNRLLSENQSKAEQWESVQTERDEIVTQRQSLISERDTLIREQQKALADRNELLNNLQRLREEREKLIQEVNRRQTKLYLLEDLPKLLSQVENRNASLEDDHQELKASYENLQLSYQTLLKDHNETRDTLTNVLRSKSWRVTEPLRRLSESRRRN